jgi:type 1 fimbria pilin
MTPSFSTSTFSPLNLFAGDFPRAGITVTIASGENLTAGAVLGQVTADDKFKLSASAAGDGSEVPKAILAEDCDASTADKEATAYFTGDFAEDALTIGTGHTLASIRWGLVDLSIFLRKTTQA